jgi:A/G-specific adenine glycosylase
VLVSEVMLQQTTVAVVRERFASFLESFPDVETLASAEEAEVLGAWAGLGYYRRARSLHACARALMADHGGLFPQTEDALRTLPGIGDYTAAAIASIAFGVPATVVDGNIERIVARLFAIEEPLPKGKRAIRDAASLLSPKERPGDYAQAMMDLGATICRPKAPQCLLCPVSGSCEARHLGIAADLPKKAARRPRKVATGTLFVLTNGAGEVLCEERPAEGLFAGMLGLPGTGWDGTAREEPADMAPAGSFVHILTHRELKIDVLRGKASETLPGTVFIAQEEAARRMPSFFAKALRTGLSSAGS